MNESHTINSSKVRSDHSRSFGSIFTNMLTVFASLLTLIPFVAGVSAPPPTEATSLPPASNSLCSVGNGSWFQSSSAAPCVLKSQSIKAEVSGYLARVSVQQHFYNPNRDKIDAQYTFPLSDTGAVDEMLVKIGPRTMKGTIRRRDQAKQMYEQARQAGFSAALLEQQRTNVFSQSIANVEPGQDIYIKVKYTETLSYADGKFKLVFPTSVGPRFCPAGYEGESIAASTLKPDNISAHVTLDEGGISITEISSPTHLAMSQHIRGSRATIDCDRFVPGKDIVIEWQVASGELQEGYLCHKDGREGYLSAVIIPPAKVAHDNAPPREFVFIIDTSGSQAGFPLEKAKQTTNYMIDRMSPKDTFQVLSFSNAVRQFSPEPSEATPSSKAAARRFVESLNAAGGTVMASAIEAACATAPSDKRLRIVTIMTDGFIDNDYDIIGMVKKLRKNSQWFSFGMGNNVNRMVIDGIAKEGGGEAEYVFEDSSCERIASTFDSRITAPVLTDVRIAGDGINISDVYPKQLGNIWEQRPLYFQARYRKSGSGTLVITANREGKPYIKRVHVDLPEHETGNKSVEQIWARTRIEDLMSRDWTAMQNPKANGKVIEEITNLSLTHHVLSQFTAFLAVDLDSPPLRNDLKSSTGHKDEVARQPVPPMDREYQQYSPNVVILSAAAVGAVVLSRTRLAPAILTAGACAGVVATIFGITRGALSSSISASFSAVVSQLNNLSCAAASGGSPSVAGSTVYLPSSIQTTTVSTGASSYSNGMTGLAMAPTSIPNAIISAGLPGFVPTNTAAQPMASESVSAATSSPYLIHGNMPFLGAITVDLQVVALLLQWVSFAVAAFVILPVYLRKSAKRSSHRIAVAAVMLFISSNIPHTCQWLLQCAQNANLV